MRNPLEITKLNLVDYAAPDRSIINCDTLHLRFTLQNMSSEQIGRLKQWVPELSEIHFGSKIVYRGFLQKTWIRGVDTPDFSKLESLLLEINARIDYHQFNISN